MKLMLKRIERGEHKLSLYLLCDEAGAPLPCQQKVVLEQEHDDIAKLHVTFVVNGRDLRIAE